MSVSGIEKAAMRIHAARELWSLGISYNPPIREPRIVRKHIDGPYLSRLNGGLHWLTLWERLLTKLGIWDAWDIEQRLCPIFSARASQDSES